MVRAQQERKIRMNVEGHRKIKKEKRKTRLKRNQSKHSEKTGDESPV